jgi:hypothetical protein
VGKQPRSASRLAYSSRCSTALLLGLVLKTEDVVCVGEGRLGGGESLRGSRCRLARRIGTSVGGVSASLLARGVGLIDARTDMGWSWVCTGDTDWEDLTKRGRAVDVDADPSSPGLGVGARSAASEDSALGEEQEELLGDDAVMLGEEAFGDDAVMLGEEAFGDDDVMLGEEAFGDNAVMLGEEE